MKKIMLWCCCLLLGIAGGCGSAIEEAEAPASVGTTAAPIEDSDPAAEVHVACVGDSLTAGFGARSYVVTLNETPGIVAENFGVCGATVCAGSAAYQHTPAYDDSLDMAPQVVVLMLGTNDSVHWPGNSAFYEDYSALVDTYLAQCDKVLLCTPLAPEKDNDFGIQRSTFEDICTVTAKVAEEKQLPLLDLYSQSTALSDYTIGDGIHPSEDTSTWMADTIAQKLIALGWVKNAAPEGTK